MNDLNRSILKSFHFPSDSQPRQYQPVEFLVTGGNLSGYNTSVGSGGYTTTRTTTTTTRRAYDSSNPNGYDETTNTSVIQGIRPYDQVDLIIQPDSSYSSSSKVLSTSVGLDQSHAPYFVLSLHDQSIREGNSVLFEVIVSGQIEFLSLQPISLLLLLFSSTCTRNCLG